GLDQDGPVEDDHREGAGRQPGVGTPAGWRKHTGCSSLYYETDPGRAGDDCSADPASGSQREVASLLCAAAIVAPGALKACQRGLQQGGGAAADWEAGYVGTRAQPARDRASPRSAADELSVRRWRAMAGNLRAMGDRFAGEKPGRSNR